jgi:hypothetical protein
MRFKDKIKELKIIRKEVTEVYEIFTDDEYFIEAKKLLEETFEELEKENF